MESWMKNLPQHLKQVPLNTLSIPGSHDTGAYNLRIDLPLAHDQPFSHWPLVRRMSSSKKLKQMIQRWAETQNVNIIDQLKLGIRYLDLRLEMLYHNGYDEEPYLVHALYGKRVIEFLEDVKVFLDQNDEEIIIFDVNHLHRMGEDGFIKTFLKPVESIFGVEMICPTNVDVARSSLERLISQNYRLIIIGPFEHCVYDLAFSHRFCKSTWPKTNNPAHLLEFMKQELKNPFRPINLHVLQGVMTAKYSNVAKHPYSNLRDELSLKALKTTVDFIESLTLEDSQKINIVITDQVDIDFTKTIIKQNYRIQ